jgi:uncharacterized protein (DUF433 family)
MEKATPYVEQRNGGYYVAGTRVSLDSVVHAYRNGAAPESILRSFPAVGTLERVYGAITFYLANQNEVDEYLKRQEALWREGRSRQSLPAELKDRLDRAREQAKPELASKS